MISRHELYWKITGSFIFPLNLHTYNTHTPYKHKWSVGHQNILSPEIQKTTMASIFKHFCSHISGTAKKKKLNKLWETVLSWKKQYYNLKWKEFGSASIQKFQFCLILTDNGSSILAELTKISPFYKYNN